MSLRLETIPGIGPITALDLDPLYAHLERIENQTECVEILPLGGTFLEAYALYGEILEKHKAPEPPEAPKHELRQSFVTVGGGQLYVQKRSGSGRPLLLLHGPADSSHQFDALLEASDVTRPLYALDLPANGESDNTYLNGLPTIQAMAEKVIAFIEATSLGQFDIFGLYGGAYVALEVARLLPHRVTELTLVGVADYTDDERHDLLENYAPDLTPKWDGTHLITAWRMIRLQGLFWPWHHMSKDSIIHEEPNIDPESL
jgi:pimeloyl-ACP methyl ester carboxylesterase